MSSARYRNTFVAIPLPEKYFPSYQNFLSVVKNSVKGTSISRTKFPHLTLIFLGDQTENNLSLIEKAIKDNLDHLKREKVKIEDLLFFGGSYPKTIYFGVVVGNGVLNFRNGVLSELTKIAGNQKKSFSPHLTVARNSNYKAVQNFLSQKDDLREYSKKISWEFKLQNILLIARDRWDNDRQKILKEFKL